MCRSSLRSMCEGKGMMQISIANCTHYTLHADTRTCNHNCVSNSVRSSLATPPPSDTAHCGHLSRVPHAMCGLEWTVDSGHMQVNN